MTLPPIFPSSLKRAFFPLLAVVVFARSGYA